MDMMRALTYVFDDRDWMTKVAITAVVTVISALLTPVLVGLLGWAALLGYMIELIRNVRLGNPNPLPRWDDFNRFLASGFNILTAWIVYSLPNLVLACGSYLFTQILGQGMIGSTISLVLSCCLLPILLIYNLIMLPLLALGMARYSEDPRINVFFEFGFLFETLRQHLNLIVQWWLAAIVVNIIAVALLVIPVLGWLVLGGLLVPVYGMLTAQLAIAVFGGLKSKPAPPAPVYRR